MAERFGQAVADVSVHAAWLFPFAAGVAGAAAASLAGLAVHRLPAMRGWRGGEPDTGLGLAAPASHCDHCGTRVPPLALIPVAGWFIADGRCSGCGGRVPWVYPAVEAGVAVASMAVVAAWGPTLVAATLLVLLWTMVFVSWIDWNEHEIPDIATVPLLFMGLLWSPFEPDATARIAGAAGSGLLMWLTFLLVQATREVDAMSLGDVALCGALGAWVGICAMPAFLLAACVAYLAYAVPMRMRGSVWSPMGPGLCAGFTLVALTGLRAF